VDTKTIMIRDKIHRPLRQYCLDHNITIIDAVSEIVANYLINKGYAINDQKKLSSKPTFSR
jgi:predicted transcriptional regulator YheO